MREYRSPAHGFTLIELMVGMAIVAILGTLALASYRSQVMKGRRSDALTSLSSLSQSLERCYAQNYTYTGCAAVSPGTVPTQNGYYQVTIALSATSYTLTAAPVSGQVNDKTCSQFMVTNAAQTAKDALGNDQTTACWGSH